MWTRAVVTVRRPGEVDAMTVKRDGEGFALELYVGEWPAENRFCPRDKCVAKPSTACAACPVPLMTPDQRRLNLELVAAGKTSASDPGTS